MIYIILALLILVLNLYLAKKTGVNLWLTGIVSLFLGIFVTIGLLLHMLFSKKSENTESMRKCPYCAEMVKEEAKVCRYCRKELPDIPLAPNPKIQPKTIHPNKPKAIHPNKQKSKFKYEPHGDD